MGNRKSKSEYEQLDQFGRHYLKVQHIDQAVESIRVGRFHYRLLLILGLGNAIDAIEVLSIGYVMAVYDYTAASVTGIERGSISAAGFVGMLFGGLLFGSLGDSLGRRRCLLISLGLNCLASLGSATAWSLESLIVFRILSGIGVGGGIPVLFTLCAEHSPSQKRGKYIAVVASFWMIGSIFTASLAWLMLREAVHGSWRQFIVFATIPAILCFALVFCFIPESPRFLASKGRYREAKDCIKRIEAINGNESRALRKKYTTVDTVSEHSSQLIKSSTRSAFGSLWDPALRKTTIVLMMSWFCLSFGSYGIATWITVIFTRVGLSDAFASANLYAMANLPGNIASALLVERLGRRNLLILAMLLSSATAALFSFESLAASKYLIVFLACAFNAFSICGWNVLDVLSAESFPTDVRSIGVGTLTASGRVGSILAQFVNASLLGPPSHEGILLATTATLMLVGGVCTMLLDREMTGTALLNSIEELTVT